MCTYDYADHERKLQSPMHRLTAVKNAVKRTCAKLGGSKVRCGIKVLPLRNVFVGVLHKRVGLLTSLNTQALSDLCCCGRRSH